MNSFSIKDLENLSGIKAHTIRIWEQRYDFLKPQRTGTNIRYYTNNELKKVLKVALLNKYGYKISHINRMSEEDIDNKIIALTQTEAQQERVVNDLLRSMVDLDIKAFEDILDEEIAAKGIDKLIMQVIFPFLEKLGILWMTSHIIPAQEHLVSNIIRQKLIAGIENAGSYVNLNKTALLFLPEGEHHELGLLFAQYTFKTHGLTVLYMGSDCPISDLEFVIKQKQPDFIFTCLTSLPSNFNFDKFAAKLKAISADTPVVVTGHFNNHFKQHAPPSIHFIYSLGEIMDYIANLQVKNPESVI
ncbi:MAG TPA: MerR family transcriptional regulator [Chitinophagaceae bacterium]|nr:MerR family transcriptional regulator [Chitinophagaceae bacterium]